MEGNQTRADTIEAASGHCAAYARLKPSLAGPVVLRGLLFGLIEHVATWPMVALIDRYHPARKELPKLAANRVLWFQLRSTELAAWVAP